MTPSRQIALGHALLGFGLLVRRLSVPAATLTFAALVFAGFEPIEAEIGAGWVFAIPVLVLLGGRLVAVGLGALGWLVFPPEHRDVLSAIALRAETDA
jgi:hypothetical protein